MQIDPGRRLFLRQPPGRGFGNAEPGEGLPGNPGRGVKAWPEPIDDHDRYQGGDIAPTLPAVEAAQIVGPHDPDEMDLGAAANQVGDGFVAVARADFGLEIGDVDARVMGERLRGLDALLERRETACVLERIARRHQPPHAVETDALHGEQAGAAVRRMRRIERAAEQADAHAGRMRRQHEAALTCAVDGGACDEREGASGRARKGILTIHGRSERLPLPKFILPPPLTPNMAKTERITAASGRCRGRGI